MKLAKIIDLKHLNLLVNNKRRITTKYVITVCLYRELCIAKADRARYVLMLLL